MARDFEAAYRKDEKDILVVTSDFPESAGGASRPGETTRWSADKEFLAYVDLTTGDVRPGKGRITWPVSDEEWNEKSWHRLDSGSVYRLTVRELADATVPAGRSPSFYNRFLLVSILETGVENPNLQAILDSYREPVRITDKDLGEFLLDKDLEVFNGGVDWLGTRISVSLDVDSDDETTWDSSLDTLRTLVAQQDERDPQFRVFAAEQLTDLANNWREEGDPEISQEDFIRRIRISDLAIYQDGSFVAFYDQDGMFTDHVILVNGSVTDGLGSATIAG